MPAALINDVAASFGKSVAAFRITSCLFISLENAANALPCEKSLFLFYIPEFGPLSEIRLPMLQFVSPPEIETKTNERRTLDRQH